ncbi:MAG: carbohydrate ABC transporter permease [Candidatus Bathyarchaeia archaeon]
MFQQIVEKEMGILRYILLILAVIIVLFPIYWMVSTSLKPQVDWMATPPVWVPKRPVIENYQVLFMEVKKEYGTGGTEWIGGAFIPASRSIMSSAIIAGLGTFFSIIIGILAAFGISRHRMGGASFPLMILMIRMIPPVVSIIPLIVLYSNLHLIDTYQGLIIAYTLFTAPYSIWMIKSFVDDIPKELEEVGIAEGLTPLETHFKITLPLIKGGVVATALFVLILNWSEFLFALVLTHGNIVTIPVQETRYFTYSGVQYGPQTALGTLAIIPLFVFGFFIQKYLVRGLTFGAIKR